MIVSCAYMFLHAWTVTSITCILHASTEIDYKRELLGMGTAAASAEAAGHSEGQLCDSYSKH